MKSLLLKQSRDVVNAVVRTLVNIKELSYPARKATMLWYYCQV